MPTVRAGFASPRSGPTKVGALFFWPRIGHEVVVIFEEGDPDQPLIIGSVYNAANMPPFTLPVKKQLGGIKSASVCDGTGRQHADGSRRRYVDVRRSAGCDRVRLVHGFDRRSTRGSNGRYNRNEEAHRKRMEELNRPSPPLDGNALGRALLKSLGCDYLNSGRPIVAADRAHESDPCDAAMHKRLCWHRLGFATERLIR